PGTIDTAVFDGAGTNDADCDVDTNITVSSLTLSGYAGTIDFNGFNITISSGLSQHSGILT
ncbi:unnamed protein product, partial [marine sediment metagenome]